MSGEPQELATRPERVWIVGQPCAGKSTLAARIAATLDADHVDLDELQWLPGWVERDDAETVALLRERLTAPRWVVAGNFGALAAEFQGRADLVVWLDLPLATISTRIVRRSIRRAWTGELCCNGNREQWWRLLHPTESLLLYTWFIHLGRRRRYLREFSGPRYLRLTGSRAVEAWVAGLEVDRVDRPTAPRGRC